MKKYIVGFLVGAFFTVSATAFADDIQNLIGKKVEAQYTVEVNGKTLKTVVVEGSNYAPVKAFSEAAGFEVTTEGKNVKVSEVKSVNNSTVTSDTAQKINNINWAIDAANKKIERYSKAIETYQTGGKDTDSETTKNDIQNTIKFYNDEINKYKENITNLQAQLSELQP